MPVNEVLRRIQGEYLEMPGLRLTSAQAQRLWDLDQVVCSTMLDALVDSKFLVRTRDGAFVRADSEMPIRIPSPTRRAAVNSAA